MKHLLFIALLISLVSCQEDLTPKLSKLHEKSVACLKANNINKAIIYSDSALQLVHQLPFNERNKVIDVTIVYADYIAHIKEYIDGYKTYTPVQLAALEERIAYLDKHMNDKDDVYGRGLADKVYVENVRYIVSTTPGMQKARKEYKEFKLIHGLE